MLGWAERKGYLGRDLDLGMGDESITTMGLEWLGHGVQVCAACIAVLGVDNVGRRSTVQDNRRRPE